ncbi:unnamed protein product [Caretta caretta]
MGTSWALCRRLDSDLSLRLTGLVLREPELRLVLSAYADDVLLVVQDPGDLAQVEACQAIYSAASSARVNWVKSAGLAVGDWRQTVSGHMLVCEKKVFKHCRNSIQRTSQAKENAAMSQFSTSYLTLVV